MRSFGVHVNSVERLAGDHEEPVSLLPSETQVCANLRQHDHSDTLAVPGENVHSIVSSANPTGRRPDIAIRIGSNAVRAAHFAIEFHRTKAPAFLQLPAIDYVVHIDSTRVRSPGVSHVQ